jgi:hypothetical protein
VLESAIEACCGSCVLCYANLVLLHSNVCAERHPEWFCRQCDVPKSAWWTVLGPFP